MISYNCCIRFVLSFAVTVVWFHFAASAQVKEVLHYSVFNKQNLPDAQHVSGFAYDFANRLYMATPAGLYCHNGVTIAAIPLQKADSTISTLCTRVYNDKHGRIWFANYPTGWGYYNPYTGAVQNFANSCNIPLKYVHQLFHDSKGRYWIASNDEADTTRCGLYLFNPVKKHLTQFKFEIPQRKHYRSNSDKVSSITEDKTGKLWLATWNGIVCFDPQTYRYQTFINQIEELEFTLFTSIQFANDSILMAGDWGLGIVEFNIKTHQWNQYLPNPRKRIIGTHNIVLSMEKLKPNIFLVGTLDGGLYTYNQLTHQFNRPVNYSNKRDPLFEEGIEVIYKLPNGNIAVGGGDNGFYIINEKSFRYHYWFIESDLHFQHSVVQINEDPKSNHYLATTIYGRNFFTINKKTNIIQSFNPFGSEFNNYSFSFLLNNGCYYINSSAGGFLFNPMLQKVDTKIQAYHSVLQSNIENFRILNNGNTLWVYQQAKLYCFDNNLKLTMVFDLSKQLGNKYFWWQCMFQVIDKRYFYTSNRTGWLICVDLQTGKSTECFRKDFKGFKDIYKDANGIIWECDFENINKIVWTGSKMQLIPIMHDAKHAVTKFHSILPVNAHEILFCSEYGLLRFNTQTGATLDIDFPDDFAGYQCNYLNKSHQLFFGGANKFIVQQAKKKQTNTHLLLNSVELMGNKLATFNSFTTHYLSLSHWQNAVNIEFAANGFSQDNIEYDYHLVTSDLDTIQTAKSESWAVYNNLKSGIYIFTVAAINEEENTITYSTPLTINIAFPWWQTWWFYTALITLVTAIIVIVYRLRIAQIRKESLLKGRLIEADLKALRSQMNPHFIFNSLNSINRYIIKSDPATASDYLTKFSKLIRLILDNSSQPLISLTKEITALRLYIELEQLRFTKQFTFSIDVIGSIDTDNVCIQPLMLQPFVENAIWHGLMHKQTDDGKLTITFNQNNNRMICIIEDNGIGRTKAVHVSSSLHEGSNSQGIEVTINRLKMANASSNIHIEDLKNNIGEANGTRVIISFEYIEN